METMITDTGVPPNVREERSHRWVNSSDANVISRMTSKGENIPNPEKPLKERTNMSDSCRRSRTRGSERVGTSKRRRCSICLRSIRKRAELCTIFSFDDLRR